MRDWRAEWTGWNAERRRGAKKISVLSKTQSQRSLEYDKLNKQVIKSVPRTSKRKQPSLCWGRWERVGDGQKGQEGSKVNLNSKCPNTTNFRQIETTHTLIQLRIQNNPDGQHCYQVMRHRLGNTRSHVTVLTLASHCASTAAHLLITHCIRHFSL